MRPARRASTAGRLTAAALAFVLLFGACDTDRRAISRDDLPDVPSEPTISVELGDDGFDPDDIDATTLDLIEFRNVGDADHGVRTEDHAIDTGPIFPGETTMVILDEPGEYTLLDTADDSETITIRVTEAPPGTPGS